MEYLFFDIEASEGKSICSFGYVLTDVHFNISEKDDILINPEAPFCTSAIGKNKEGKDRGITLAYPKETFISSPVFPKVYPRIKNIVEHPDRLVIGFAHSNDIRYLRTACDRYSLPYFTYKFFDLQDVFRAEMHESNQISLKKIIDDAGVNIDGYVLHKSVDDAEISMLAAKAFCEKNNCTFSDLIEKYHAFIGNTHNGVTSYHGIDSEKSIERKNKNICRNTVLLFARTFKPHDDRKNDSLYGKKFCAGSGFEKNDWHFALQLITVLASHGARYVASAKDADYYIKFYDDEGNKSDRLTFILNNEELHLTVLSKEELYDLLQTTEEQIKSVSTRRIQKIVNKLELLPKTHYLND